MGLLWGVLLIHAQCGAKRVTWNGVSFLSVGSSGADAPDAKRSQSGGWLSPGVSWQLPNREGPL